MCETCVLVVSHMYCMCINYTYNTPKTPHMYAGFSSPYFSLFESTFKTSFLLKFREASGPSLHCSTEKAAGE